MNWASPDVRQVTMSAMNRVNKVLTDRGAKPVDYARVGLYEMSEAGYKRAFRNREVISRNLSIIEETAVGLDWEDTEKACLRSLWRQSRRAIAEVDGFIGSYLSNRSFEGGF